MNITGSQIVLESLLKEGVETIFGYPGGAIMPIYDALYDYRNSLRHILVRHEQGAAHAAEGYALVTGRPGVCFATSGPGATNLVTGIADAMLDSVPLVCITGQVHASLVGTDAFQEVDVIGVTTPITKWNYQVQDAHEIAEVIARAFHIARSGRPGPVLIDITKNAQIEKAPFLYPKKIHIQGYEPIIQPQISEIKKAAQLLNTAERPYILAGHGILIANAEQELQALAEKADIPVASTLLGLSALPNSHRLYVGMLGMHGNYGPNMLTNKADVILAIGMRFDDRVTGRLKDYAPQAKIIHIDIDPAELNKNIQTTIGIVADARFALSKLIKYLQKKDHTSWLAEFNTYAVQEKEKIIDNELSPTEGPITMGEVINKVSFLTKEEAIIVADVGQHQMKAARYSRFKKSKSFITSGGAGTMGYALPAAIGAKVGSQDRDVIAFIGDGGFQMTIQELGTIMQENIPVKIIILNNHYLGMVRQWQELFFEKRYSFVHLDNPNFIQIAKGFRIHGEEVTERTQLDSALERMLKHNGPYILDVTVAQEENVFPMIPTGAAVNEVRLT